MFENAGSSSTAQSQGVFTTSTGIPQRDPGSNALLLPSSLVQVAPLPLTTDFHAGKVMELGGLPPTPTHEREETYIPVALARAQLSKVVADMHAMKAEQVQKLGEILDHYRGIEKDTRERHEARVRALKERAETKVKELREQYVDLEKAGAIREDLHVKEKQVLLDEQENQRIRHLEAHETWRQEFECALQAHEDEFVKEQKAALDEIKRVSRVAVHTGQRVQQQLRNELEMCSEDARGAAMRVDEQLRSARMDMETQHRSFLDREAELRRHFAANLDVERFLHALIDNVVDRKQQAAEEKRAQNLHAKLRELEAKSKDAGSREETLKRRLKAARDRFKFIEAQAVQETVNLLVHAVVVTLEGAPSKTPPVTLDAPTQTQDFVVESKVESNVEEVPTEILTEVPVLSLDKTKYESEVEVARERNLALIRSKAALHEAKEKLDVVTKAKRTAKTAVKSWLSAFQDQHGREPTIEEKAQVKEKYLAFKDAENAFSTQKALVLTLKQQHRELALRIDASSRWSALGFAVVKSPRTARTERVVEEHEDDESQSSSRSDLDEKSSRPASSSTTRSLPPSIDTKDSSTDAATEFQDEAVETLEKELQELRLQLSNVNSVQQQERPREHVSGADEAAVQPQIAEPFDSAANPQTSKLSEVFVGDKSRVDITKDDDPPPVLSAQPETKIKAEEVSAVDQKLREEAKAREEELDRQYQLQRLALQKEIATLSKEIEERRVEKTRLETEIEQLRLHLELSEARDSNVSDCPPPSEAKTDSDTTRSDDTASEKVDDDDKATDDLDAKAVDKVDTVGDQEQNDDYEEEFEAAQAEAKDADDEPAEQDLDDDDEKEEPEEKESEAVKEDAARSLHLVQVIGDAVARGKAQFNRGDKAKCYQTYAKCAEKCIAELQALHEKQRRQDASAVKRVLAESARLPPARGPQTLRKQLDAVRESCEQWLKNREEQAAARLVEQNTRKEVKAAAAAIRKQQLLEKKQKKFEHRDEDKKSHKKKSSPPQSSGNGTPAAGGGKVLEDAKQKLRALETKAKADRIKISQLEAALAKAETQLSNGGGSGGSSSSAGENASAASNRRVADMEKKQKKALEDNEKVAKKEISALTQQLQAAQKASQELQEQSAALQKELGVAGGKAKQLGQLEVEVTQLREQAALIAPLNNELREAKAQFATLETSYREEQALRKKYYNQIEDMKGKIRVYARCRPMSGSENERGCAPCVKFLDEFSLEVSGGNRAAKTFAYDQVFSPASSQMQVFEDTKNLLQSAVDGYNVCIFAYGQTGSGKTFTMTGIEWDPGLSPRTIHHLFALADEGKANFTVTFQATMLELYNDTLIDLFHLMDGGGAHDKLEIKKNDKGMVVVQNATLKKCTSPEQTLKLFEAANKKRQVGATKMNAESSRSHSIFSLLVESYNKTTKATTIGKLSLVDLAGSERAGKTGATADRLKEAQAINKSLSALGDVISALSTNEKFIPYRNNKLTQLMQDSLGGNAKTLMFVNISPADYNQEETVTSLTYASRVKLITNNANKNSESEQVNRLKAIIKQLRAGKTDVDLEGVVD